MQQQEMQQQRQSEALLHQQVFQQHQIYPECHATQQQILANGRHPGVIKNVPQEQLNGLAPHPPAQQGSPLNPHPQPFWASRPPSCSGVAQACSTLGASNHLQLQPLPPFTNPPQTCRQLFCLSIDTAVRFPHLALTNKIERNRV
ncbi:hypothetical protein BY996DRAFT_7372048 [Phakopsora pachyrhizi]|uniref:Uncharacterized protein n=1 Tax=Phakopsora pachyrhizi TaxID=170000 RepID=A0AAV0ARB4_PHAPC|nr:hypothetical protein BY996DRAFT_7372048 [Phakopsora pachyrhizi]CAH7670326.1 hypothetical protein PPACK8108_LOCUS5016 [Phakopsora pachyrhizi]